MKSNISTISLDMLNKEEYRVLEGLGRSAGEKTITLMPGDQKRLKVYIRLDELDLIHFEKTYPLGPNVNGYYNVSLTRTGLEGLKKGRRYERGYKSPRLGFSF